MTLHRTQARADRHLLADQYPALFAESGGGRIKRPLADSVVADLIQRGVVDQAGDYLCARRIADAVRFYQQGPKYTSCIARGGPRFGLDGNPCGEVSAEEQARAQDKLKARGWNGFFDADGAPRSNPKRRAA